MRSTSLALAISKSTLTPNAICLELPARLKVYDIMPDSTIQNLRSTEVGAELFEIINKQAGIVLISSGIFHVDIHYSKAYELEEIIQSIIEAVCYVLEIKDKKSLKLKYFQPLESDPLTVVKNTRIGRREISILLQEPNPESEVDSEEKDGCPVVDSQD